MSVETLVSVEQYLNTAYDPDVEYVDGVLRERNAGDWLHSLIQSNVIYALRRKYPNLKVVSELRSQTATTRFRLPDITVLFTAPETRYLTSAAWIAIEILSEDDRMSRMMEKLAEYATAGVQHIWLIDPRLRQLSVFSAGALVLVDGFRTDDSVVELTPAEIFQA
jgi:Uma2 family endonuclease